MVASIFNLSTSGKDFRVSLRRLLQWIIFCSLAFSALGQRQLEKLGRGVVAIRQSSTQVYVGWRLLGSDPDNTSFNLYSVTSGVTNLLAANVTNTCNFVDTGAAQALAHSYYVQPVLDGVTQALSGAFVMPANAPVQAYLNIPLTPPPDGVAADGVPYTYNANDCSVGDVDGDGEYEIFLKWDPSNSHDNSQSGMTGNTFLDCYKLNGTRLWRIDLGPNIRSGAHYMDFMVFDFDGDGKAEMICRTAPGSKDGLGNYVGGAAKWQNSNGPRPTFNDTDDYRYNNPNGVTNGYVLAGPEFLTVFNGLTGEEMATVTYYPKRDQDNNNDNPTASRINTIWGDSYGNRIDRFLAGVAYLDGIRPSALFCRGYYTRAFLVAWDWRNSQLTKRWVFDSNSGSSTNLNYRGQGAHSLTIGDADGDGRDDIVYGAASIDHNGQGLYSTLLGHGDALHFSDMDPLRPGVEIWMVHETPSQYGPTGLEYRDAKTGALIFGLDGQNADVGRGVAYDIDPRYRGYEMWGARGGLMSATGVQITASRPSQMNFCVWWDADYLRETLDGTTIYKWDWINSVNNPILSPASLSSNNGTKSTPCLSADILGDWREEVIWRTSDNLNLRIYTTTTPATNRFYTLMHDPQYRCAIAWQNTGYNQPPHPSFFLGQDMFPPPEPIVSTADLVWRGGGANNWDSGATLNWFTNGIWVSNNTATSFSNGRTVLFDLSGSNNSPVTLNGSLLPAAVKVHSASDYVFQGPGQLTGAMKLIKAGQGRLTFSNANTYSGTTYVRGGSLFVNGTLLSPVLVERRGTPEGPSELGGNGGLAQGLTMQAGCVLTIGPGTNAAGTLTVTNSVSEGGNVVNRFDLSNDPTGLTNANDQLVIYGNLSLTGTNILEINQLNGALGGGVYNLIRYNGSLNGGLSNLALSGAFVQPVSLTNPPGVIALVAAVPGSPPNAPGNLAATAVGAFRIDLGWKDNSSDENAFLLERSTNNITFAQVTATSANVTNYSDPGLLPSTTYYYRVRATNVAGFSGYSTVASATTATTPPFLTWRGSSTNGVWDLGVTANWFDGASMGVFGNGADVTFDDAGSNSLPVTLTGTLSPDSVIVNATKAYTVNGSGSLSGAMALVKGNTGSFTLSTTNSFSGGVNLNAGGLTLGDPSSGGSGPLNLNGGVLTLNGVGAPATFANATMVSGTAGLSIAGSGNNNQAISGALSGNGLLNIGVGSGGTFSLRGSMSAFSGTVAMTNSGTLRLYGSAVGSSSAAFDLGAGTATMRTRDGGTVAFGSLSGGSGASLAGATSSDVASTYNIGANNANTTFAGSIVNGNNTARSVAINKVGLGVLTLAGPGSYSGTTTVSAGILLVNGDFSAATNLMTVAPGATLGGTGFVGGNSIINGELAPGNAAIGTLTFNRNLTLTTNSATVLELSKTPFTNDVIRVLGQAVFAGAIEVDNVSPDLLDVGDSFKLFDAPTNSGAFSSITLPALDSGKGWDTSTLSVNGRISVIATNPPLFSGVAADGRVTSAIISWSTSSNTTSQVEYGSTTNTSLLSPLDSQLVSTHAVLLTGLTPDTNYFFRARAQSGANIFRSSQFSFNTSGNLIVDNPDATYSGNWIVGTSATDKYGSYYQYAAAIFDASPSAQATYTPNLPTDGIYDVYIWYPAGSNRATNTPVTLFGANAVIEAAVDQTTNGGSWQRLAPSMFFTAGTGGFAVIGNNSGDTNTIVMADAMRWSYNLGQDHPTDGTVPDWWAEFYFGSSVDGAADPDGDGMSNYAEYVTGTDPTDAASHLQMNVTRAGADIQIAFNPFLSGRVYELQTTPNLNNGLWAALPNLPVANGGDAAFTVTNAPAASFYRIAVRLAP
jgi:rhamnogalacturonan endolyase